MAAPITSATAAYTSALARADAPGMEPPGGTGAGFAGVLKDAMGEVTNQLRAGEKASIAGIAGKSGVADVVNAVNNADVTLQAVLAVRDRMVSAYQDILRMPM